MSVQILCLILTGICLFLLSYNLFLCLGCIYTNKQCEHFVFPFFEICFHLLDGFLCSTDVFNFWKIGDIHSSFCCSYQQIWCHEDWTWNFHCGKFIWLITWYFYLRNGFSYRPYCWIIFGNSCFSRIHPYHFYYLIIGMQLLIGSF